MQTTRINTKAKVSGNTMINIKSRMNLSVNKQHHNLTLDMNLFSVFFFYLYIPTFKQYKTMKTTDARKKMREKDAGKNEFYL